MTALGKRSDHERLAELIRTGGIAWHENTNPAWRGKPWQDGIPLDVDDEDTCNYLARYLLWKLPTHHRPRGDHQVIRKLATAAALTAAIVAAPGVASATPGDPGQCTGTGVCQVEPSDNGALDESFVVVQPPSGSDMFFSIAGHALADFVFGPQW